MAAIEFEVLFIYFSNVCQEKKLNHFHFLDLLYRTSILGFKKGEQSLDFAFLKIAVAELYFYSSVCILVTESSLSYPKYRFRYLLIRLVPTKRIDALAHTVICFVSTSAKFGICTVVGINGKLVEDKMRTF
jgi:hypothetical protein